LRCYLLDKIRRCGSRYYFGIRSDETENFEQADLSLFVSKNRSTFGIVLGFFEAMSDDPDFEYLIVDSTVVRAHQHAAGAKKGDLKIKCSAARAVA